MNHFETLKEFLASIPLHGMAIDRESGTYVSLAMEATGDFERDFLAARDIKLAIKERFGGDYRGEITICERWVTLTVYFDRIDPTMCQVLPVGRL